MFFAHSKPDRPLSEWELLETHLDAVGRRASEFGEAFGAEVLAALAGRWHDLGKASEAFQTRVLGLSADEAATDAEGGGNDTARTRVDHSTAGARHAATTLTGPRGTTDVGHLLAYVIAAHHGRLANWDGAGSDSELRRRLDPACRRIEPYDVSAAGDVVIDARDLIPTGFTALPNDKHALAFQLAFLTRMIFSSLVDADRLETERFYDEIMSSQRPKPVPIRLLREQCEQYIHQLAASRRGDPAPVDHHRAQVLQACIEAADRERATYSLTVPTGGGKTLASLNFALRHADRHNMRRVIYALPFTSIIEQTAATFRNVFDDPHGRIVLEHHSNLDPDSPARQSMTAQMAAENWDAPIIVTTNVQLFESLFSAHGSTCRKLHRIAGSVIVLDEAQAVPPQLLKPVLAVIDELVRNYRCTVVLCTATQPAIIRRETFPIGLEHVTEIVPDPPALYEAMRRVEVEQLGLIEDELLACRLVNHDQVLCIVNTRKHAAILCELLEERGVEVLHLSAAMCPEHRSQRVAIIRDALKEGRPCRIVSTQVIEAGVDVDFPVVYRALAGFDSIAQAAGRCNREGRSDTGMVYVFETEHRPALSMRAQVAAAAELLPDQPDPLDLHAIERYFGLVYWKRKHEGQKPWDVKDVMGCFQPGMNHRFRDADRDFRWIDQQTTPIVVPYDDTGRSIVDHLLKDDEPDWQLLRRAQRYSVSVYDNQLAILQENTLIAPCFPDEQGQTKFWALTNPRGYDDQLGLRMEVEGWDGKTLTV